MMSTSRKYAPKYAISITDMKLYSYVVKCDTGFAPNPFWGYCTLATCKPGIRLSAREGDWVIGTGSVRNVGQDRLVYAMRVGRPLPLEDYYTDPKYADKKPVISGTLRQRCGDNTYFKENGQWRRHPSDYHREPDKMKKDIDGRNVLIAECFYYFGSDAKVIPLQFRDLIVVRGYKYRHDPQTVKNFLNWLKTSFKSGVDGAPYDNPGCGCC